MSALGLGISFHKRRILPASGGSKLTYPGLIAAWSAAGKSNDDADRAVLRDLTGNGHDITLNNFAFKGLSGYGGYATNIGSWSIGSSGIVVNKIDNNTITITESIWNPATVVFVWSDTQYTSKKQKFKITGLIDGQTITFGSSYDDIIAEATQDGNYEIDWNLIKGTSFMIFTNFISKCNITIESLPEYPDALVFDGVDDCGINEEMPLQTDYTIIVKRKIIQYDTYQQCGIITKRTSAAIYGAFWLERGKDTWSYGASTQVEPINNDITWQNKISYNGTPITTGSLNDLNTINIGRNYTGGSYFISMAFYSAYLFDRSLDEQEIKAFIRKYIDADYLLPSEISTPDCYYDFTNGDNASETRDTIVDLSGNGNDAKAYNFAWNEEGSGYKDGALQFDGTDDNVALLTPKKFRTVFIVVNWEMNFKMIYGQRDTSSVPAETNNAIYTQSQAYRATNPDGITYLNGKKNTHVDSADLNGKKHCITEIYTNTGTNKCTGTIIGASTGPQHFMKMSLYKFLAFEEELTEKQIQYVIEKYNLLDGVDEIEVS